jgi:FAD/FMN-containing dehydrogenase
LAVSFRGQQFAARTEDEQAGFLAFLTPVRVGAHLRVVTHRLCQGLGQAGRQLDVVRVEGSSSLTVETHVAPHGATDAEHGAQLVIDSVRPQDGSVAAAARGAILGGGPQRRGRGGRPCQVTEQVDVFGHELVFPVVHTQLAAVVDEVFYPGRGGRNSGVRADVASVVNAARRLGLRVAAQTTGHTPLHDLDDTILLKTADLAGVDIGHDARRARIGAGTVWIEVTTPASEHNLAPLAGSAPDVGVAGYVLGGGLSWLARKHGLASGHLLAAEVVTADGDIVRTDADHEPDLLWALRGGGGSFAVVTAVEVELFPVPQLCAGGLFWPWERTSEVLHAWNQWQATAPENITSSARILHLPPLPELPAPLRGRSVVNIDTAVLGGPALTADLLQPLRALRPELDTFAPVRPAELSRLHLEPEQPTPAIRDHQLLSDLGEAGIDTLVRAAGPGSGSKLMIVELRQLGGAVARPANGGGAMTSIHAPLSLLAGSPVTTAGAKAEIAEDLEQLATAMRPRNAGYYLNWTEDQKDTAAFFPPETYRRLRQVKAQVDPDDIIRSNHPIAPAQD